MGGMKIALFLKILGLVAPKLAPETVKKLGDCMLDVIEDAIADSETKTDDRFVLPLIKVLRATLDIPDGDD
jgi:hypothetical protein